MHSLFVLAFITGVAALQSRCKTSPSDYDWPSAEDWSNLNATIDGVLIKTKPAASSCYPGNPFNSSLSCAVIEENWSYADFQAILPEGTGAPIWANNSCLPPTASGYLSNKECKVGGAPAYVVNATSEEQIATAMKWASSRNIRIVVKGTGHDLNGR